MGIADQVKDLAKTAKETIMSAANAAVAVGSDPRDIRNVLKRDHEAVAGMMDEILANAEGNDTNVMDLVEAMRGELLLHAKSEEKALYEACRRHGKDLKIFAQESEREHELIEHLLGKLATERPGKDGELKATVTVLQEIVMHHVREEEGDLFQKLVAEFSESQLVEIGREMEAIKSRTDVASLLRNSEKPSIH